MRITKGERVFNVPMDTKTPHHELVPPVYADPEPDEVHTITTALNEAHSGVETARTIPFSEVTERSSVTQGPIPFGIERLLHRFEDVLPEDLPKGLPPSRATDHRIDLVPNAVPPSHRIFRMNPAEDKELKKQLDEYLAHGWIEPARSAFGAGVLFASKHDG